MRIVSPDIGDKIYLGKQGENLVTEVHIDVTGWKDEYGDGIFTLFHKRSEDPDGYPVSITVEDETVKWIVNSADLQYAGNGRCELTYTVDETIAKSTMYSTVVLAALDSSGEVPDPWQPWVDEVNQARDDAEQAASDAEIAASHYPYIGTNLHWYIWDVDAGEYIDTGVEASGYTYIFRQQVPSATWEIEHNLGRYPTITVIDSANDVVAGDIRYIDENHIEITFQSAFSGTAYLN